MNKKVLVPVADGTEELEAVGIIDVLRRAGAVVTVASVCESRHIIASKGLRIIADKMIAECMDETFDLVALPGGIPGAENLRDSTELTTILKRQASHNRLYAAICASPAVVLEHHGLLEGKSATCHPAFVEGLSNRTNIASRVMVDGNCITSQGAGTSIEFALALVELLYGKEKRDAVARPMVV